MQKWTEYKEDHPEFASIVQEGLDKLEDYHDRADFVPAYVLAMGNIADYLWELMLIIIIS